MTIAQSLMLLCEHDPCRTEQSLELLRHIECGDREVFTRKAMDYLVATVIDLPGDVQEQMVLGCEDPALKCRMMRAVAGMTQAEVSTYFGISKRCIENWECGQRKCPSYLINLMLYKLQHEGLIFQIRRDKESQMTYGELFSKFTQQHPEIAVDDYRPAPGAYTITVWEKGTDHVYVVRYQPDNDSFTITKND